MAENYYQILGLKFDATSGDVSTAYRKLARIYHPDKNNGDDTKFKKITVAYEVLKNKTSREQYDIEIGYKMRESNAETKLPKEFYKRSNFTSRTFTDLFGKYYRIYVDIEDIYNGETKKITLPDRNKEIQFRIPRGCPNGHIVNIEMGLETHRLVLIENYNENLRRINNNLYHICKLDLMQAIVGVEYVVYTFNKQNVTLKYKLGAFIKTSAKDYSISENKVIIKSMGMPDHQNPHICGDLIIDIFIIPPKINEETAHEMALKILESSGILNDN